MASAPHTFGHRVNKRARRWVRYKSATRIKIVAAGLEDTPTVEGHCVQISAGGMCFFAVGNFDLGDRVNVEFIRPESANSGRVRGIIRNRAVYLYGMEYEIANLSN